MEAIRELAQFLTTLCCGLFAGAAIYVNLVEHPARMECGTEIAATEFSPSYRRAAVMQASLAATGLGGGLVHRFTRLPKGIERGRNENAFLGGKRLWETKRNSRELKWRLL